MGSRFIYGSLWRWKCWSVRQIKPALLAFGRTLIIIVTYLLTYLCTLAVITDRYAYESCRRVRRGCGCADRPTRGSNGRRWWPAGRRGSARTTAVEVLAGRGTRRRTGRPGRCTTDCSWVWTPRRPCTSFRPPRTSWRYELQLNGRVESIYYIIHIHSNKFDLVVVVVL